MQLHKLYIHKKIKNPYEDGLEIGVEIKRKIGRPSLIIFITSVFDEEKLKMVFEGIKEYVSLDGLIGCSTGGTFVGNKYIKNDGVLILAFDRYYKYATTYKKIEKGAEETGKIVATDIKNTLREKYMYSLDVEDKFLGFIFFDWNANHEQEILDVLGKELGFPIVGGTAGDDGSFDKIFLIYKGNIVRDGCVFGVIGGKLKFDLIYGHGYEPTNIYARVTKAKGRVVYELDGKPAYQRYLEMISEYTKLPTKVIEKYLRINKKERLKYINFYLIHPLGFIDINGNAITTFLEDVDGNRLIFRRKIAEGSFLILMRTDLERQVKALSDKIRIIEKDYKNPLIFINECYGIEILKNPLYRKFEENPLPYFLEFYNDIKKIDKYVIGDNCIGWLSYGETISKDIMRFHNNLSFTGVVFGLEDICVNWKESLKNFNFTDEEIEVIVNLIYDELNIKELSEVTKIPIEKLRDILKNLEKRGIVGYIDITGKYYIDNLKEVLKKIDEELDFEYKIKKAGRERVLKIL
ncbi:transcriptional regulator [Methanocaldococcus bathoardescens]|uniref:Transcriptional regulator n=1 Tax=Methanocaldococcus bathoardescens TaxID=1301915 RepID=A0A076LHE7_9EURY|nr:FIST N-terminal domain-containing protein [Methanocaldococcus bathoardescens]AIJ05888.1 transcriptional regulator [Methanocaldococcus bathoardescens]